MKSNEQAIDIYTKVILKVVMVGMSLYFLYLIRDIITLLLVAVVVMAAINPVVDWLEKHKVPRPIGVLSIYCTLILFLGTAISILAPIIASQFKEFWGDVPGYLGKLDVTLTGVDINAQELVGKIGDGVSNSSSGIFSKTVGVFSSLFSFVVVFSMAFYMSIMRDGMEKFLEYLTPKKYKKQVIETAVKIKEKIGRWMLGQLLLMLVIFILDYAVLYFLDVPYALAIAILGGFLEIIPYVGPTVSAVVATLIAFFASPVKGVLVLIFYSLIQQAENHIIVPQIMKRAVGLNPLIVIFSLLAGMKVAGMAGVILAVPFATAVNVIIEGFSKNGE